jgi:hypothetical protein
VLLVLVLLRQTGSPLVVGEISVDAQPARRRDLVGQVAEYLELVGIHGDLYTKRLESAGYRSCSRDFHPQVR